MTGVLNVDSGKGPFALRFGAAINLRESCVARILESAYMNSNSFDPTPEEQVVVLVEFSDVRKCELQIIGCEACSEDAWLTFDSVLDTVTGSDPNITDYLMEVPARCPRCSWEIHEISLVEPA